jgi:hypothetical protein
MRISFRQEQGLDVARIAVMRCLFGVILLMLAATAALAQSAPQWTITLTHREERLRDERVRGATELGALRRIGRGAIGADVRWIDEATRGSVGFGAEAYAPLWRMAESRFRLFSAPRALSQPDLLVAAEVTQHIAGGWQLSLSGDDRRYDQGRVNVILGGAGWSSERWFIRGRAGAVVTEARTMATGDALVRRTSADRRRHLQLSGSIGGDVFDFADPGGTTPLIIADATNVGLHALFPATADLGVMAGVAIGDYGRFGTRAQLEAGVALYVGQ